MSSRLKAVARRWADIVVLTAAGFGIGVTALPYLDCRRVLLETARFWPGVLAAAGVLAWRFGRAPRAYFGLRHFWSYPPTWIAGLAAAGGVTAYALVFKGAVRQDVCPTSFLTTPDVVRSLGGTLALVAVALIVSAIIVGRLARRPSAPSSGTAAGGTRDAYGAHAEWVGSDLPIQRVEEDRFKYAVLARRLAALISSDTEPTIALVGPTGAGKSSLLNLVAEFLAADGISSRTLEFVQISLWPFETVDAAVAGVLRKLTSAMETHISTLQFRGLAEEYLTAIEKVGPSWTALIRLVGPRSPKEVLTAYDHAASAIGVRFVLWVDDFERFAGIGRRDLEPEVLRLGPLRALLNELSDLETVQVVLASGAADFRFDIEKFARFVLDIPPLERNDVIRIVRDVRQGAIARFKDDMDVLSPNERQGTWKTDSVQESLGWLESLGHMTIGRAFASICHTPRDLKQALRYFLDTWERLHGEIDVDDVLIVSFLRAAEPSISTLINAHIGELRHGTSSRLLGKKEKSKSPFALELEEFLTRSATRDSDEIRFLLTELFSGWEHGEPSKGRPQGFAAEHTDYWRRYIAMERPVADAGDQRLLNLIAAWKRSSTNGELPRVLIAGEKPALEALLAALLTTDQLTWLLVNVVRAHEREAAHSWPGSGEPPGVIAVWRVMLKRSPQGAMLERVLLELIAEVLPSNVPLAYSLVNFFATPSNQVPLVLDGGAVERVALSFRNALRDTFAGKADDLVKAIVGARPPTLYWSSWGLDRIRSGQCEGVPFERWDAFAPSLLEAVAKSPQEMLPQLLPFVVRRKERVEHEGAGRLVQIADFDVDERRVDELFGLDPFVRTYRAVAGTALNDPEQQKQHEAIAQWVGGRASARG